MSNLGEFCKNCSKWTKRKEDSDYAVCAAKKLKRLTHHLDWCKHYELRKANG